MPAAPLPPLSPQTSVARPLSATEYYHASVGQSRHTLETAREITFIVEGQGEVPPAAWRAALQQVCQANPGCRLQLAGRRRHSRWHSDGPLPELRFVDGSHWDGRSEAGADFIRQQPLALDGAPGLELIVAGGTPVRVIVRVLHAMMDGIGVMHFLQELFRALRGEPLLGSNAAFSDVDLMRSIPGGRRTGGKAAPACLVGSARGSATGDSWRRLSLRGPQPELLARTALAVAEFARRHDTQPVRLAVPVNLRRHCPGLHSTLNFSSMLHVDVGAGDDTAAFRAQLARLLEDRVETDCPALVDVIRWLPLPWLDRLLSRTPANYRRRRLLETAVLSNLGRYPAAALSGGGFTASRLFGIPLGDNACSFLFSVDDHTDISFGMANVYAADGRLDAFMAFLGERLGQA
jgi:hypothetical protein